MKDMENIFVKYENIIHTYFENDAKKLYGMIDKILFRLKFNVDNQDFYSLGNEIFIDVLKRYDESQSFDGFLYTCLTNKFKTEMTKRNRYKRQADKMAISIYTPLKDGDDGDNSTLEDVIADDFNIEKEIFEEKEEGYSKKMLLYLSRLSNLQKEVLRLTIAGYLPGEIKEELHITDKQYSDCSAAIHSYRNVLVLM